MNSPKVSVIVPVYNAEKYLSQCIQSILNQTLEDIEVIVVNDGSTDKSREIVGRYSSNDSRIKVINGDNGGVSCARNLGIKAAKGAFIGFVDADDWIDSVMYEDLYNKITFAKGQLAICNVTVFGKNIDESTRLILKNEVIDFLEYRDQELYNLLRFKYDYANWNKLYDLEIIRKCHLEFDEKIQVGEDLLFNLVYMQYISSGVVVSNSYYHYRRHDASITKDQNKFIMGYNLVYERFKTFCQKNGFSQQWIIFQKNRTESCIGIFNSYIQEKDFRKSISDLRKSLMLLNSEIYLDNSKQNHLLRGYEKLLLQKKRYALFSILYVGEKFIRAKLRKAWGEKKLM